MDGVSVVGYELESSSGDITRLDRDTVNKLVLNNQVYGCKAQKYKGQIMIKGVDINLKKIPKIDIRQKNTNEKVIKKTLTIIKRVINRNEVYGYVIKKDTGEEAVFNKQDTIDIIKKGIVKNARVQKNNGQYIIRGVNCNLNQLDAISISKLQKVRK